MGLRLRNETKKMCGLPVSAADVNHSKLVLIRGPPPEVVPKYSGRIFPFEFRPSFPESLAEWKARSLKSVLSWVYHFYFTPILFPERFVF